MPQRPGRPNLLDQDFTCEGTDQKWGVDISYIWTAEGWLFLAIVLALYSRRIVGWATSDGLKKDLAPSALRRAIALRQPMAGLIPHSDRGGQYCSHDYQKLLKAHGMAASMSGKGNCFDNAMVETVFKAIKSQMVWRTSFQTRAAAELALGRYIDGFYNPRRRHSALGYKAPVSFEAMTALQSESPSTKSGTPTVASMSIWGRRPSLAPRRKVSAITHCQNPNDDVESDCVKNKRRLCWADRPFVSAPSFRLELERQRPVCPKFALGE